MPWYGDFLKHLYNYSSPFSMIHFLFCPRKGRLPREMPVFCAARRCQWFAGSFPWLLGLGCTSAWLVGSPLKGYCCCYFLGEAGYPKMEYWLNEGLTSLFSRGQNRSFILSHDAACWADESGRYRGSIFIHRYDLTCMSRCIFFSLGRQSNIRLWEILWSDLLTSSPRWSTSHNLLVISFFMTRLFHVPLLQFLIGRSNLCFAAFSLSCCFGLGLVTLGQWCQWILDCWGLFCGAFGKPAFAGVLASWKDGKGKEGHCVQNLHSNLVHFSSVASNSDGTASGSLRLFWSCIVDIQTCLQ